MAFSVNHPIDHERLNMDPLPVIGTMYSNGPEQPFAAVVERPEIDDTSFKLNFGRLREPSLALTDPATGIKLGGYLLNPGANRRNGMRAVIPTWLSDPSTNHGNQLFYALLAASNPDQQTLVISTFGLGTSEVLPEETRDDMARTGRFKGAGKIISGALQADSLQPTILNGNSSGARYVLGTAGELGTDSLEQLSICDAPIEDIYKLAPAFFIKESGHRSRSRSISNDPYCHTPAEIQYESVKDFSFAGLVRHLGRAGILQKKAEVQAFGRGLIPFSEDLQEAVSKHNGLKVSVINPAASEVTPHVDKVRYAIRKIYLDNAGIIKHVVIPDATHSFDSSHPLILVKLYNY